LKGFFNKIKSLSIMQRFTLALAFFFTLAGVFTSCQKETLNDVAQVSTPGSQSVGDRSANTIVDIAISNPDFSTLVAAVVKTNQVALLSDATLNATVFAPTNAAFAKLPAPFNNAQNVSGITDANTIRTLREIIRYHVAQGRRTAAQLPNGNYRTFLSASVPSGNLIFVGRSAANEVFINGGSKVVAADVAASNGVIHVIDNVLFPPSRDIFNIAANNPNFTALTAALRVTGLSEVVMSPKSNFTVFAPTDAAFAKLPAPLNDAASIRAIKDPATIAVLRNVVLYHVLGGRVFSADLREGIKPATALPNKSLLISLLNGATVKGDGNAAASNIVLVNILAYNGVIHAVDQVLLP
jgi:uncharacterized surface protein with fasciclin (FAS1) repeats